ncbi:MAG: hypothetical protein IK084_02435 [Bacteroidaceae bacterium]|nr:hypothetical protein [Bacteroidaceae bacterium]
MDYTKIKNELQKIKDDAGDELEKIVYTRGFYDGANSAVERITNLLGEMIKREI